MGGSKDDGELNVKNRVLVGVFGTYMFILKEKWANWSQCTDGEEIKEIKKCFCRGKKLGEENEGPQPPKTDDGGDFQAKMEEYCNIVNHEMEHMCSHV